MKIFATTIAAVVTAAGGLATSAFAQHQHPGGSGHKASTAAEGQHPYTEGEVKELDKGAAKITLKAGEIPNIDMPPMTMPFFVREPRMLDNLKIGDKVRFRAINDAGKFILTELMPVN